VEDKESVEPGVSYNHLGGAPSMFPQHKEYLGHSIHL